MKCNITDILPQRNLFHVITPEKTFTLKDAKSLPLQHK